MRSELMRARWLVALLVCWCSALAHAQLPVQNLAFDAWNTDGTMPLGWSGGDPGYRASRDCEQRREGRCTLRLQSLSATADGAFGSLSQHLPSSAAAGYRLRWSGWIRTHEVKDAFASIWMRVDADFRKAVASDSMAMRAPHGTTDWQRFEILLPVAPNTRDVWFGVMLVGRGSAWFDDLKLELDTSVVVPKVDETPRGKVVPLVPK